MGNRYFVADRMTFDPAHPYGVYDSRDLPDDTDEARNAVPENILPVAVYQTLSDAHRFRNQLNAQEAKLPTEAESQEEQADTPLKFNTYHIVELATQRLLFVGDDPADEKPFEIGYIKYTRREAAAIAYGLCTVFFARECTPDTNAQDAINALEKIALTGINTPW